MAVRPRTPTALMLVGVLAVSVAPSAARDRGPDVLDWPQLHRDLRNSKFAPLAGPRTLVPTWHALDGRAATTFVATGRHGRVYALTMDPGPCHLHALDREGQVVWCSDEVRTLFSSVATSADGGVFVSDGTEVFRFEEDGGIAWRVPASGPALAVVFTREGYPAIIDYRAVATVYDPSSGAIVAGPLALPVGFFPRPSPLPSGLQAFSTGAPLAGWDPAFVDTFIDAFQGFDTAVGNNAPAVHPESGRIFIAVPADPSKTTGLLYGIDFTPATGTTPAALTIGCTAPMGLRTSTSPSISADGSHIYAGDQSGTLFAFDTRDCGIAWSLPLGGAALASPTAGLAGRLYMLINGRVTAIQDDGASARVRWQSDIAPLAQLEGFAGGRFQSTIPLRQNYLYGAATYYRTVPGSTASVPAASVLATIDAETGAIVSTAQLGEESNSVVSLTRDGTIFVASKPIVKAQALGTPSLAPHVAPARAGIYAFEPASYLELALEGIGVAVGFADRAAAALNTGDTEAALLEVDRALQQARVVPETLQRALDRGEIARRASILASARLHAAGVLLRSASRAIERQGRASETLLQLARTQLEAASATVGR